MDAGVRLPGPGGEGKCGLEVPGMTISTLLLMPSRPHSLKPVTKPPFANRLSIVEELRLCGAFNWILEPHQRAIDTLFPSHRVGVVS